MIIELLIIIFLLWLVWKFFSSWLWWILLFAAIIWMIKVFFWGAIILVVLGVIGAFANNNQQ
ncbi:hypothetical protein [Lactobacillus sp. Sy-1]|uniref:hypothetical protein n=1 Tax=Lactobacillus sp. Sy-1 TaxID=2109645 RepID=UPI001C5AC52C|nr:hypothetical protein [Lactobacillus sp. Sy-1]MBW1606277.1 hypothetical protein [Lactobacillus sp. Sy-1]